MPMLLSALVFISSAQLSTFMLRCDKFLSITHLKYLRPDIKNISRIYKRHTFLFSIYFFILNSKLCLKGHNAIWSPFD